MGTLVLFSTEIFMFGNRRSVIGEQYWGNFLYHSYFTLQCCWNNSLLDRCEEFVTYTNLFHYRYTVKWLPTIASMMV